jgi:hypothetical protein
MTIIRHEIPVWRRSDHFETRTVFRHHNIDAINPQETAARPSRHQSVRGTEAGQDLRRRVEILVVPNRRAHDDNEPDAKTTCLGRPAHRWSGGVRRDRSGPGARGLPTNQSGLSGRGLRTGRRAGRYRAADPLHHAHHAGEDSAAKSAAKRAQTLAESRSATGGGVQSKECALRAAAGIAVGGIVTAVAG